VLVRDRRHRSAIFTDVEVGHVTHVRTLRIFQPVLL
jgi:hypothetical protein